MRLKTNLPVDFLVVIFITTWLSSAGFSQECSAMSRTLFSACKDAGYNSTFQIPYKIDKDTELVISSLLSYLLGAEKKNSTIQLRSYDNLGETIVCSILSPRCTAGKVNLPCKRVCSEFLRRVTITDPFRLQYIISHCKLLPEDKASSGKCFEPPGFDKHHNRSNTDLLDVKCSKLIFPWCQGLGYQHTTVNESTQVALYQQLYGKNFTHNSTVDMTYSNDSILWYWVKLQEEFNVCASDIQKMTCAQLLPACFPGEGTVYYTACRSTCFNLRRNCPNLAKRWKLPVGGFFINHCEALGFGHFSNGFCKHSSWPKPFAWLHHFIKDDPSSTVTPTPTTASSTTHSTLSTHQGPKLTKSSTNIIEITVIAVCVLLVIIGLIVVGLLLWRHRKRLRVSRMLKRADDDTIAIVKEELQLEENTPKLEFDCY